MVLTHDVEGSKGLSRVKRLVEIERKQGFRSCFNLVPEGEYRVADATREMLDRLGFEVGIHGLEHDGKLYSSKNRIRSEGSANQSVPKKMEVRRVPFSVDAAQAELAARTRGGI